MKYRIVGDSCCDLDQSRLDKREVALVPLMLQIGDYHVSDDEKFQQRDFIRRMAESSIGPKTACPSATAFKEAYERNKGCDGIFVVTLSEHLSATYQSAVIGKDMFEEEHGQETRIFVLSSHSASAGQLRIILELERLFSLNLEFEEITKRIVEFRDRMKTYFVLESLENLRKNGRISGLSAFFATALNIKPVMGAVEGVIIKLDQARGTNKALKRMVDIAVKEAGAQTDQVKVCITHVNNFERAEQVAELFRAAANFQDIILSNAAGVATVYAGDGGIVIGIG